MTLQEMILKSRHIVFFGGAGVSTESGIPDFRSPNGLYNQSYPAPPETILSHQYFMAHPQEFFRFYRERMLYLKAQPNAAHRKLAQLERSGKLEAVVTQNIDGLHQKAGSSRVFELHGSVFRNHCMACGKPFGVEAVMQGGEVPKCACGGTIKPDVVLYEESLDAQTMADAAAAIRRADLLIVAGTSLKVHPAAGLLGYFKGGDLVLINRDPTPADRMATLAIHRKVGEVFAALQIESG